MTNPVTMNGAPMDRIEEKLDRIDQRLDDIDKNLAVNNTLLEDMFLRHRVYLYS